MKFLFASDSFKGSLSSQRIAELLEESAKCVFPACECVGLPVADGGEGTVEAVLAAAGGSRKCVTVKGPLFQDIPAHYGILGDGRAVIEMAEASGFPLIPPKQRNPMETTTFGTGQLILDALETGCREIAIAIGGSATNDGGMGAMTALGVRFLDDAGNRLLGCGKDLLRVSRIDSTGMHPAVKETRFTIMSDVTCPLTGPQGAVMIFGKQKGADAAMRQELETGMLRYEKLLADYTGKKIGAVPGAGAAGGLGAAFFAFLPAEMKSGIDAVLDLIHFDDYLRGVDLVVTGEGRMDEQSAFGKVPAGVGIRCKKHNIPVAALVGGLGDGAENCFSLGIDSMMTSINRVMDMEEAIEQAEQLYRDAAVRMFRMIEIGTKIK